MSSNELKEEVDLESVLIGLSNCEKDMDHAEKDAEIYRIGKTSSIYDKRRSFLVQIPKFWYIVLAQNEDFADYISADDLKFLENIKDIHVQHLVKLDHTKSENPRDFSITFRFSAFDSTIGEQEVTKYFESSLDEDGEEKLTSTPLLIKWPEEYDNINPSKIQDKTSKEGKRNYRQGMKSFFAWFKWTGLKPGKEFRQGEELARLIADDLFPYAVKYYTELMPGLGEDGDDSSEELDLSDSEDEEIEEDLGSKRKLDDSTEDGPAKKK